MTARPLRATYRLQFNAGFRFADAQALIGYFAQLGVSHLYASPITTARTGSTHGYDVVDPTRIDPALGGEEGFRTLVAALHRHDMGLVVDIVPNHMATDAANPFWMEMLAFGRTAPAAAIFDVDWARGRLLLPVLGATLLDVLRQGEIKLGIEAGRVVARYHGQAAPLRPASVAALLRLAGAQAAASAWEQAEARSDRAAIAAARSALTEAPASHGDALANVLAGADLPALLADQHWRLAHWRTARDEVSHRRFFNITELIGVRVEDETVFETTHRLVLDLVADGSIDALRIDHIDGLADPAGYAARLRAAVGPNVPIFVEKILGAGEELRPWPVDGTTGYDTLNHINGLFVDAEGYRTLAGHLRAAQLIAGGPAKRLASAKRQVLAESFVAEVEQLTALAVACAEAAKPRPEFGTEALRRGLLALLVHFPVYRTYAGDDGPDAWDAAVWALTLANMGRHEDDWTHAASTFLVSILSQDRTESAKSLRTRFQQLTGPAMAKGFEDTELYRNLALASVNEVGGDVVEPWRSPERFHAIFVKRTAGRVLDQVPLATHDTKRGADTRARLSVLSRHASDWIAFSTRWAEHLAGLRTLVDDEPAPDDLDVWLIHQTVAGTWPISSERLQDYLCKALREAKRHSAWEQPNEAYEAATFAYATALIEAASAAPFREALGDLVASHEAEARTIAIAQTILQLTLPGIPDIYQGTELWDWTLVDPDNRRPVDWATRRALLDALDRPRIADDDLGATKFAVIRTCLALRRDRPVLFAPGSYEPRQVRALGSAATPAFLSFSRGDGAERLLVVVPTPGSIGAKPIRLETTPALAGGWLDALTGETFVIDATGHLDLAGEWPFIVATASPAETRTVA